MTTDNTLNMVDFLYIFFFIHYLFHLYKHQGVLYKALITFKATNVIQKFFILSQNE